MGMACFILLERLSSVFKVYHDLVVAIGPSGYLGVGLADPAQCQTRNIGGICVGSVVDG